MFQPIHSWASIRVSGADRFEFLQGQLTQDLDKIRDGQPMLAGWANAKGRLLCIAWVLDWNDAVHLILPANLIDSVARRLGMYVLRSQVEISQPDTAVWFLTNKDSEESAPIPCFKSTFCIFQLNNSSRLMLGFGQLPDTIAGTDNAHTDTEWRAACITAGLPWVYQATNEIFVPQMLNLDLLNAISFSKGCYVGQEIVARTQNLGRIKRRMFAFETNGTNIQAGAAVSAGDDNAGTVVDAVADGEHTQLLAVIRLEKLKAELNVNGAILRATELPYPVPQ
jgi:folate-binding protein YgfZ